MRRKSGYSNQRQSTDSSSTREHLLLSGCVQSVFPTQSNLVDRQLVHGYAEIFGAELVEGKAYIFGSECKAAVFTWQGCTIEMSLFTSFRSPFLCIILRGTTGSGSLQNGNKYYTETCCHGFRPLADGSAVTTFSHHQRTATQ